MSTQTPPTPPTPPNLPPQALLVLAAHHTAQSTLLATLLTTLTTLRENYSILKALHPSLTPQISLLDTHAINRAAHAKATEMLEQPGRDFDRQFGTDYQPGWVKEEVLEKVKQGRERVILARLEVMLWERLCKQFENPAARGEGEERGSGL